MEVLVMTGGVNHRAETRFKYVQEREAGETSVKRQLKAHR